MPGDDQLTRITIVDDHELFAEALDLALTYQHFQVARVSVGDRPRSMDHVLAGVRRQSPEVIVLDLDLGPAGDGAGLVRPLTEDGGAVMVVSASTDRARLGECLRLGARTVVSKTEPLDSVLEQVGRLAAGVPAMTAEDRAALVACCPDHELASADRARLGSLSRREGEVLGDLVRGRTVDDIARRSCVSTATVRTQVKAIRRKLEVGTQLAAVAVALRARWTPPGPVRSI